MSEIRRLAADLGHLFDELLAQAGPSYVSAADREGLTAAQAHLLLALHQAHGPLTLAALAERTQRSVLNIGRPVERLRAKALVERHDDTPERQVELTESGHAHLRALQTDRRARLEHYVGAMTATQRLRLAGALHLLSRRLDADLAHPDLRAAATAA